MSTASSSKPNGGDPGVPPTDMELMLYVDGELDELRHQQVDAYVLRDATSRAKIAGLDVVADVLRDDALSRRFADDIAGAVMAKIEAAQVDGANGAVERSPLATDLAAQGSATGARARLGKQPANDNARGILALSAIAVAAAAALMVWGRMEAEPPRFALTAPVPTEAAPAPPTSPARELAAAPGPDGEVAPGVEVAAVDFGARMGTIFYVPQGSAASSPMTTVVWLSDDGLGGK